MSKEVKLYNGKTAHHDLYFGGGCFPNALTCPDLGSKEDYERLKEKMSYKTSGLGHKNTGALIGMDQKLNGKLWPAPPVYEPGSDKECLNPTQMAAHRGPITFGNSRHLCFVCPSEKGLRKPYANQDALMRYYWEERECNMAVPFSMGVVLVPGETVLHGVMVKVYGLAPGVVFDVVERFSGEMILEGVDASEESCAWVPMPPALQMDKSLRVIDICINEMPPLNEDPCKKDTPSMLDGLCVMVSAVICCPDTGNG